MKKILFSITNLIFVIICNSQEITLQTFYDRYDKLLAKKRTYFVDIINPVVWLYDDNDAIPDSTLNIDVCQRYGLERIKYVEKYLTDTMPNIRYNAITLIAYIGHLSKIPEVRQRAVIDILNSLYIINDNQEIEYLLSFFKIKDYNDQAKERIKEILIGTKKDFEIEYETKYSIKEDFISSGMLYRKTLELEKKTNKPFKYIRDSLLKVEIEETKKFYKDFLCLCSRISLLPGILYMYDFVPEMEQMLKDNRFSSEYLYNFKLDLARMGNKQYEYEILNQIEIDGSRVSLYKIFFINSQTAAKFCIKEFINRDSFYYSFEGVKGKINYAWECYYEISKWILNFPDEFKINPYDSYVDDKDDFILSQEDEKKFKKGKKWLNKNIGKFELNPNIRFYFAFE